MSLKILVNRFSDLTAARKEFCHKKVDVMLYNEHKVGVTFMLTRSGLIPQIPMEVQKMPDFRLIGSLKPPVTADKEMELYVVYRTNEEVLEAFQKGV